MTLRRLARALLIALAARRERGLRRDQRGAGARPGRRQPATPLIAGFKSTFGHYATVAKNIAVECGGVTVRPGDILVADEDGVVVVPQDRASEVLKEAQSIDARESGMYPFIRQFKSLQEAIKKFNRI